MPHRAPLPTLRIGRTTHTIHGVQVVLIQDGRVYVQFRLFPAGWELPGGHVEPGETLEGAAVREVEEETGCRIALDTCVGIYTWEGLRSATDAVFVGHIVSGTPHRTLEAVRYTFAKEHQLPRMLFPWFHCRIIDAVRASQDGSWEPIHRSQRVTPLHVLAFVSAWFLHPFDKYLPHRPVKE